MIAGWIFLRNLVENHPLIEVARKRYSSQKSSQNTPGVGTCIVERPMKETQLVEKVGLPSMNNAGKGKGWTNAGITRFNVLFKEVKQDRINCPLFVKRFLNEKRESKEEVETSKPKKRKEVVIPLDDLGEDLDEFADLDVASTKQEAMDEGSTSSRSRSDDSDEETDYEGIHGVPV